MAATQLDEPAVRTATTTVTRVVGPRGPRVGRVLLYVVLTLGGLVMIVPFLWMLLTSVKTQAEVNTFTWWPKGLHWHNYVDAFSVAPFGTYFRNSLILVVGQTIPVLLISTAAGYALAQLPIRSRKVLLNYFIVLIMVPFQVLIVPLFLVIRHIPLAGGNDLLGHGGFGWINSWAGLIVPFVSAPLYVFLSRQFFVSLPGELADAARADGMSELGIFLRIMMPLAKPALVTIALFNSQSAWNSFIWPLVVTSSENLRPMQFGLATFAHGSQVQWPLLMAMSAVAMLPVVLLFLFGQRYFVAGLANAGIKG